ncbi:Insulin-like growth factor I [Merluccius polli]|uniref:Insulin-like growth factor I n=1 Tax=Merluccius polli TaxID=89951 RepID=A0AA47P695_MERPO|nr:Insulin-like growth factor I [Merluccius polli]KAK0148177.1 Insulin-like growth factor I [Merluccius polli]
MWRLCVLYSAVCLSLWQPSDAGRLRCGSDLLADLLFVCGDRGIYLGRGSWSGYGSRPRGKGIVDHCCSSVGCDLQHLELYCAKSKKPTTTTTATATATTSSMTSSTSTTTFTPIAALQFEAVFQKRLLEHLGPPNSQRRSNSRRKTHNSPRRRKVSASPRKGTTRQQPTSKSALGSQKPNLS